MSSSTSAAWASVVIAAIATGANVWQACEAHAEINIARIAKETLDSERREVAALQKEAVVQRQTLSNALERVNLYGDILAAEGGDRWAYKRAKEYLLLHSADERTSEPIIQTLSHITELFQSDITNNNLIVFHAINLPPPFYDSRNVMSNLKSADWTKRLNAVGTIWSLRLNNYIPDIVDIAKDEPNLNVLQLLIHVVRKTFEDNMVIGDETPVYALSLDDCVFQYDEFKKQFMEMWNPAKARIMARKPKEARQGQDKKPPHLGMVYLFDPEKPDDIPVLK